MKTEQHTAESKDEENDGEHVDSQPHHNLRPCIHPNRRYNESQSLRPRKRQFSRLKCGSESVPPQEASLLPRCASRFQSKVWLFCEKFYDEAGERKAKCKLCNAVLCYAGGSTRGILHHLRTIHADVTRGIIQPVIKKPLTLVGGIDVDDDGAWVQEIDDEADNSSSTADTFTGQLPEYQDKLKQREADSNKEKEQGLEYAALASEEAPSYAGEVFLREDGSYVTEEGDEFVDVVYVQEGELDEQLSKHPTQTFIPSSATQTTRKSEVCSPESGSSINGRILKSSTSKQMAVSNSMEGNEAHFEMADYSVAEYHGAGSSRNVHGRADVLLSESGGSRLSLKAQWRGNRQHQHPPLDIDDHFGNVVALSLKTLPVEQRPRARAAILQCIAEFRDSSGVEGGHL